MSDKEQKLYSVLQKFYEKGELDKLWSEAKHEKLTGKMWKMNGNRLSYLFLEIEKEFQHTFAAADIVEGKFNSIADIMKLLG